MPISLGLYHPDVPGIRAREVIDVSGCLVIYAPAGSHALWLTATVPEFASWVRRYQARHAGAGDGVNQPAF